MSYKTSDIALGSYLKLKGFVVDVKKINENKAVFHFEGELANKEADEYYNGKGDFLAYSSSLRSLKSQTMNLLRGGKDANQ